MEGEETGVGWIDHCCAAAPSDDLLGGVEVKKSERNAKKEEKEKVLMPYIEPPCDELWGNGRLNLCS